MLRISPHHKEYNKYDNKNIETSSKQKIEK